MLLMVTVSLLLPVNSNPVVVVEGGTVTLGELGMIDQDQDTYDGQRGGQSDNYYRPVLPLPLLDLFFHNICVGLFFPGVRG